MSLLWLHAGLLLLVMGVFHHLFMRGLQEKALFGMAKVRDAFVMLLAQSQLTQDDPVFAHFYPRIQRILEQAPDLALDDIADAVFDLRFRGDHDHALRLAQQKLTQVHGLQEMAHPKVRAAVCQYDQAVALLMISHSRLLGLLTALGRLKAVQGLERQLTMARQSRIGFVVHNKRLLDRAQRTLEGVGDTLHNGV